MVNLAYRGLFRFIKIKERKNKLKQSALPCIVFVWGWWHACLCFAKQNEKKCRNCRLTFCISNVADRAQQTINSMVLYYALRNTAEHSIAQIVIYQREFSNHILLNQPLFRLLLSVLAFNGPLSSCNSPVQTIYRRTGRRLSRKHSGDYSEKVNICIGFDYDGNQCV